MGLLLYLRQRLLWWPLYDWFALFLAWVYKAPTFRHGGVRTYRSLLPFFLGLILGEVATACKWVFIDGTHGVGWNMIFNY